MTRPALVLAAHGSASESTTNARLRDLARAVADRDVFDEVKVTFHQGDPPYSAVLDTLAADRVVVVPVMTSDGYYATAVLPRELAKNRRYTDRDIHITAPIGTHRRVVSLVAKRVRKILRTSDLLCTDTSLAIVGHGTARHAQSRIATEALASGLRELRLCAEVLVAFLDDQPPVESLCVRATTNNLLVIPFLIGVGTHATMDIPTRLGLSPTTSESPRLDEWVGGRRIIIDAAIGGDPHWVDVILELAIACEGAEPQALACATDQ